MRAPSGVALEVLALEPEQPHPVSADDRPEILIRPELNAMTDDALAALAARPALAVYVRAGMLVTVAWDGSSPERWLRRPPGAPRIVQLDHARMRGLMDSAARWMKPGGHRKDVRAPAMPPGDIAAQVLARHEWPLPYLQAVVETPVIRPDGSVLNRSGYDVESELLYQPVPGQQGWPGVPARPTDSDVRAAVDALAEPVAQFPFKAGTDLSAYVAAVLTALAREMIPGPIPAFVVRAPTPGTGKTLLVVVVALTGTGRAPAVMAMTYDGEELRKRITSIALSGTPLVLVDNASGALGSDALAGALTATEWEDRILGVSQMVRLPLRAIWFVTGNNISFRKTLARRVVPIDLDAGVETPEDRTGFHHADLASYVREHRLRLVAAGLTVLRAFILAGRPTHGGAKLGSFEGWDDLVRSAVIWAGMDDPASANDPSRGRGRIRAEADDDVENLNILLQALHKAYPDAAELRARTP